MFSDSRGGVSPVLFGPAGAVGLSAGLARCASMPGGNSIFRQKTAEGTAVFCFPRMAAVTVDFASRKCNLLILNLFSYLRKYRSDS